MQSVEKLCAQQNELAEAIQSILDCALILIVPDPMKYYDYMS